MVYTPKDVEEDEEEKEEYTFPNYSIFNSSTDPDGISLLNFSRYKQRGFFPDYTAEKKYSDDEREVWEIRNGAGTVEAEINTDHSSKDRLAYKLQNVYETLI